MARPQKQGIDYFTIDVDIDQDDKIVLIEAETGLLGFAILIKLLAKIYHEGYYYRWSECERLLFCSKLKADISIIDKVVTIALKWGFFNKKIYDQYGVLTSSGIQKRYLKAITRRKESTMIKEFILIDIPESEEKFKTKIILVNADINEVNENINPQSKVKESKVKETTTQNAENDYKNDQKIADVVLGDSDLKKLEDLRIEIIQTLIPSVNELQSMRQMLDLLPINQVIVIIREANKNYKPKFPGDKIRAITYFLPLVQTAAAAIKSRDKPIEQKNKIIENIENSDYLTKEIIELIPEWMAKEVANSG